MSPPHFPPFKATMRPDRPSAMLMSPFGAFIYNSLTMGMIFPWVFVIGPAVFPQGHLVEGILIAIALQIPLAVSYAALATVMPTMGGDYAYQSRILGRGVAFVIVFSGFVLWVLQWLALSGWMIVSLGLSPLLLALGSLWQTPSLVHWGLTIDHPVYVAIISVVCSALATIILIRGFHHYMRLQYVIFYLTLLAGAAMVILFLSTTPAIFTTHFNDFARHVTGQRNFIGHIYLLARQAGWHPPETTSLWASLGIAPVAWINLQWSTYSVEQGSEIRSQGVFWTNLWVMLGPLLFIGLILAALAFSETHAVTRSFLSAFAFVYSRNPGLEPLHPFPGILAMALAHQTWVVVLILLGFIANSFQIFANCYIGITRIMAVMAEDRLLPRWLSYRHPRFNTLANGHVAYFLAGVIWILVYNFDPYWIHYTLEVALANGYVFVASAGIAALMLPYRLSSLWNSVALPHNVYWGIPWITWTAIVATITGGFMLSMLTLDARYGAATPLPFMLLMGLLLLALVIYRLTQAFHLVKNLNPVHTKMSP